MSRSLAFGIAAAVSVPFCAPASPLAPDPIGSSALTLRIEPIAQAQPPDTGRPDFAAPVIVGGRLHVVDQAQGRILRDDGGGGFVEILSPDKMPEGVTPVRQRVLNIAGGAGSDVFVTFTSSTLPTGFAAAQPLPEDSAYGSEPNYQVVYRYSQAADGSLASPVPLAAFESRSSGHSGGGMLALPDGDLLLATGDNLGFDRDGLAAPQDPASHLGKLLMIDSETGETTVAAQGVRNVQRLAYADADRSRIVFADIGSTTAEEINEISVGDLTDTGEIENFGWGRNDDGNAREGTFYINEGVGSSEGGEPRAIGAAPVPETGFRQPYAQYGHEGRRFVAISGPVTSDSAFDMIVALFGDLPTGDLYATMAPLGGTDVPVFRIALVDASGAPVSLFALAGERRPDPRFFALPDGTAGVMLEHTGTLYSLTEVAPIPLPGAAGLLVSAGLGLGALRLAARRRLARSRSARATDGAPMRGRSALP
ncbi:PQQ-dependent sugar dehydrogenase [Rhodovulum sp. 12E13]|uniref:PQQ-dependent sugar dehydrogenase n=1 Tax=Rhodovulum sp. 12E13 TaxID=2203891 RepID=UPI0013146E50|nr:PQQ-dependent sugar dehydrogenase [Rhodovulum sp. 12E13]